MLETIRQYAREKLLEAGSSEIIRNQHLTYFVKLVEQAEPELYRSNQAFWLNKLDDELDNLRMALEWAFAIDLESGLRIAALPWRWCDMHGYFREMGAWLSQFLERYVVADSLHIQALVSYSICLIRQGRFAEALKIAGQGLQMARTLSDKQAEAQSLHILGALTGFHGKVEEGILLLEQSLDLYRALGYKIGQANVLSVLATNSSNRERASAFAREGLQINRELGNLSGIADSLIPLTRLTIWSGDFSSPATWPEEALSIVRQVGDQTTEENILMIYGVLAYWQGNYHRAHTYYKEVIQLSEKLGDHFIGIWVHVFMAYTLLREGVIRQARELFEECIQRAYKADWTINLVFAVEGLASLNVNQGQSERAVRLFAWTDEMRDKIGDHRPPVEQASVEKDLAVIHSKMDDIEFTYLSAEGHAMTVEQAIGLALEE
jgi:tetratricopeptide (TPR) repeat protein